MAWVLVKNTVVPLEEVAWELVCSCKAFLWDNQGGCWALDRNNLLQLLPVGVWVYRELREEVEVVVACREQQ